MISGVATLSKPQVNQLSAMVAAFIQQQRDRHFASAKLLTEKQQAVFQPFFPNEVLQNTRFYSGKISDPPFLKEVAKMGITNVPTAASSAAITYIDVIVAQETYTDQLRFHELVHAVQYRELGVEKFAEAYVRGFLTGGGYFGIPLEKNAYELDARFAANPKSAFDVLTEIRKWRFEKLETRN